MTDAQIAASGAGCPFGGPLVGRDRLNKVVATGHALIPADAVINITNVQTLSGLTPEQYAAQASAAVGRPAGFFFFGPFGALFHAAIPPQPFPTSIDTRFETPYTLSFSVGVQRELTRNTIVELDYYHRDIRNMLGLRQSNIAFQARVVGRSFLPPFPRGTDQHLWTLLQREVRRVDRQLY